MSPSKSATHTWLQLLRAPNLFTVPGDPLAGFLLVSGGRIDGRLVCAVFASLCLYAFGLLLNDLADLEEDRRDRPNRPLPSGAAQPGTVWGVAGVLAAVALLLSAFSTRHALFAGLVLLAVIVFYNLWAKRFPVVGPLNMGLCRGFSLLLGASAAQSPASASFPLLVWLAAASLTLYIAIVTNLARVETEVRPPLLPRTLPYIALIVGIIAIFFAALDWRHPMDPFNAALYAVSAYTLYAGFKIHQKLTLEPTPPIPPMIGQLIRLLLPLQAIWCLATHGLTGGLSACALLILWPISRTVSRRFYAS